MQPKAGYHCEVCNKVISAWYTKARTCSRECWRIIRRKKVFKCVVCLKVWEPYNRATQNKRKTCGDVCLKKLQRGVT